MTNYIRGDLLLYTNKGIKRIDKLTKSDLVNSVNNNNIEIDEINKNNVKAYQYLFKLKTIHNIDNYYLSGNNKIYCIQNIPYELKMKDCANFIEDNKRICKPSFINVSDLTDFDYIGYPVNFNDVNNNVNNDVNDNVNNDVNDNVNNDVNDNDKYRFQGLILLEQYLFNLNNNLNKNTIGFLNKYLHNNDIKFELFNNNISTSIKIDINENENGNKLIVLTEEELFNLSYENTKTLLKGFIEINSVVNTLNKNNFYLLKRLFMKIGVLITANYINNNYVIKIPQSLDNTSDNNYFIYDNYIWSKVKKIVRAQDKYFGQLYNLKMKDNNKYLTEVGVIS
jgi:hypothetical protein